MIDLNPNYLETVECILAEHVPECEVRAFGSRVTWTAKDYSDLDLAVVGDGPLNIGTLGRLKEAFQESDLPTRVDVLDWHAISENFRKVIERDYIVVQHENRMSKNGTLEQWHETTLRECVVINNGTYSSSEAWPWVNYLDTGNITENRIAEIQHLVAGRDTIPSRARRKVQPGDIVYSTVRPNQKHFGLIKKAPENFLASTGFAVVRGQDGLADTDFIYWFLTQDHIVEYLHSIAENSTSAYPSIKPSDLGQLRLLLPPLFEQRAIAHVLGTLDDKIELNRRMNETLEAMARALFQSWFVDFDPVRAKMEGRDTGLPPDIEALFPDRLVDSELGEIPEGWRVGTVGDVASQYRSGVDPVKISLGTPYIALDHMPRRCIALDSWESADKVASSKFRFKQGDILFGKLRPYFHKVGVAPTDGVCSTDIVVVSLKSADWFGFVLGHLSSSKFVDYADTTSTGTKMPRTKWTDIARYEVAIPGGELVNAFAALAQPCIAGIMPRIHESHALAALRDALLPQLVSGQVRMRESFEKVDHAQV